MHTLNDNIKIIKKKTLWVINCYGDNNQVPIYTVLYEDSLIKWLIA